MTERPKVSNSSLRGKRRKERLAIMQAAKPPGVRVIPANDDVRRIMRHPTRGGFAESGGVEWPNDRFTKRRLAEGSVTLEEREREPPPEGGARSDNGDKRHRAQRDQSRQRVEHRDEGLRENIDPDRKRDPDIERRDNDPDNAA